MQFDLPTLEEELGQPPDLDLFARRYQPPVPHEKLGAADAEYNVHRIQIAGVTIRYVEGRLSVQLTVEGELPQPTLAVLTRDLLEKLAALESSPCERVRL